jgi:hypothetical protein
MNRIKETYMENILTSDERPLYNENVFETILSIERKYDKPDINEASFGLTAEDGNNFFHYLKKLNLANDPHLLILPPNNHYYFDEDELNSVRTIINLKNLNLIKDLDTFLFTLTSILPLHVNFIGFFSFNKITFKPDVLFSGLTARLANLLDSKTDHNMNRKEISDRLQKYGFRVADMTDLNGHTYFYSQHDSQFKRHVA